ncbi:restriction endonuclease-like protein [Bacillus sp. 1780r2a1]|nr:restriction endonuclease-like protein [Bacillus sp. 1780r2a1]
MRHSDIHHSGQIPFVKITTKDCTITISGKVETLNKDASESMFFSCTGQDIETVEVYHPEEGEHVQSSPLQPLFFENEQYEVMVVLKGTKELFLVNEMTGIKQKSRNVYGEGQSILFSTIFLQNEIGYTTFHVMSGIEKIIAFTLEIFPIKMDYKSDYLSMVKSINQSTYGMAYKLIGNTYLEGSLDLTVKEGNWLEFYHVLSHHFQPFMKYINQIEKQPTRTILKEKEFMRGDQLKKPDSLSIGYLRKHPNYFVPAKRGIRLKRNKYVIPNKAIGTSRSDTVDTLENQTMKWMLMTVENKLEQLFLHVMNRKEEYHGSMVKRNMIEEINRMQQAVKTVHSNFFWKQISTKSVYSIDRRIRQIPVYKEVCKYYMMLMRGITLNGEFYTLSLKNTAWLYEYWVYLRIRDLLQTHATLITHNSIKMIENGLFMNTGASHHAFVSNSGKRIYLFYQKEFRSKYTTTQRPDLVLAFEQSNGKYENYVFDAKYRVQRKNHKLIPKEEDLNTMHRYRDAILNSENERIIQKAIVLFPSNDKSSADLFLQSVEKVGVGALPFLPTNENIVKDFILGLLTKFN